MRRVSYAIRFNQISPLKELLIPRPFATKLLFEAQKEPDVEVCGLVGAVAGHATTLYPIDNISDTPASRFLMEPKAQIQAMECMRERGEDLLAVYHSHPTTPPEPSLRDLEEIGYPEVVMLIISLNIKGVLEMRAWQKSGDTMAAVPLKAMPTS